MAHIEELIEELRPQFKAADVQLTGWRRSLDYETKGEIVYYTPADAILPTGLVNKLSIYGPDTVTFVPGPDLTGCTSLLSGDRRQNSRSSALSMPRSPS